MTPTKIELLDALRDRMEASPAGRLFPRTTTTLVFGNGSPDAALMIVGEAPGEQEDLQGIPFCGPSGDVLDRVLSRIGLSRADVYVTNILKRRPPGNRDPEPREVAESLPWLKAQITVIRPTVLLALGRHAANVLAGTEDQPIGALRERRDLHCVIERAGIDVPVVATYHPAYVLRQLRYGPTDLKKMASDIFLAVTASRGGVFLPVTA